jgi:hypothetical protein
MRVNILGSGTIFDWIMIAVGSYANVFLTRAVPSSTRHQEKCCEASFNGSDGVVAHTETFLVSDHPVCAGCCGFAAFSYWRSHPSSRGEYATPKYVTVIPKGSTKARDCMIDSTFNASADTNV